MKRVLDAVDNSTLYDAIGEPNDTSALDEHIAECRAAMQALFEASSKAWTWCAETGRAGRAPQVDASEPLAKLYTEYPELTDRVLAPYRDALLRVAETADAKERDFVYFTLGALSVMRATQSAKAAANPVKEPLMERLRNSFSRMSTSSDD